MHEQTFSPMSKGRIIDTLQELKTKYRGHTPSKYYFALGHAIRCIEHAPQQNNSPDSERLPYRCPKCKTGHTTRAMAVYCCR